MCNFTNYLFQFYSINVQILGDEKKKIRNIVARWAGSTHDARIWSNCDAKRIFENQSEFMIAGKVHLSATANLLSGANNLYWKSAL